ncbi:MAG: hypothetical protein DMF61_24655 [Blastocatellia bacterium AA13]|nr:MAG: hypothetical protein DMF61_24655 [Blastocatellia bacterium AA13]
MERDKEIEKLVNVLRRVARSANYAAFNKVEPDAAQFCAAQYNRLLARLTQLEPAVAQAFAPLADSAPPEITRIAARELAAYFEDESSPECGGRRHRRRRGFGTVRVAW